MFKKLRGMFSSDLSIDLGTANTLIYVRERGIVAGATHGDMVEVREGLSEADRVVARGAGFLGDGDLVRVVDGDGSDGAAAGAPAA